MMGHTPAVVTDLEMSQSDREHRRFEWSRAGILTDIFFPWPEPTGSGTIVLDDDFRKEIKYDKDGTSHSNVKPKSKEVPG